TTAAAGIASTAFPETLHDRKPQIQAVDQHTLKQDPWLPPPNPPGNPFVGWTDVQKAQVAAEIAHGHALGHSPPGTAPPELARQIYDVMNDPATRFATSIKSGGLALLGKDGTVIFIDPTNPDYGTAFTPKAQSGDSWRTPLEYFEQNTRALE